MVKSTIYLIVFSLGFIWVLIDIIRFKHKKLNSEYQALYIENKILLAVIFFAVAMMQAEKIWNF